MALSQRIGKYGTYWGNDFATSSYLNETQREINAKYISSYLTDKGWTLNAIASILGNMEAESTLNPGCWQNHAVNVGPAYGLVQWDPFTKYTSWVQSGLKGDPSTMDNNLDRIIYELNNNLQYYATADYPESFTEFTKSTKDITYLTTAFLKNYERAGVERLEERISYSNKWYNLLKGNTPVTPGGSTTKKHKFKFVLFTKNRRIYG